MYGDKMRLPIDEYIIQQRIDKDAVIYSDTAPTTTDVIWFDTVNNIGKIYNPSISSWVDIGGSGGSVAVVQTDTEPTDTNVVWFDTNAEKPRIYNLINDKWGYVKYFCGYDGFDNSAGGLWTNYINIPITTTSTESIQYKVEINGDNINIYSNDGTTILTTLTGGLDFWLKFNLMVKILECLMKHILKIIFG
jgi:hypothetical protein